DCPLPRSFERTSSEHQTRGRIHSRRIAFLGRADLAAGAFLSVARIVPARGAKLMHDLQPSRNLGWTLIVRPLVALLAILIVFEMTARALLKKQQDGGPLPYFLAPVVRVINEYLTVKAHVLHQWFLYLPACVLVPVTAYLALKKGMVLY